MLKVFISNIDDPANASFLFSRAQLLAVLASLGASDVTINYSGGGGNYSGDVSSAARQGLAASGR